MKMRTMRSRPTRSTKLPTQAARRIAIPVDTKPYIDAGSWAVITMSQRKSESGMERFDAPRYPGKSQSRTSRRQIRSFERSRSYRTRSSVCFDAIIASIRKPSVPRHVLSKQSQEASPIDRWKVRCGCGHSFDRTRCILITTPTLPWL